MKKNLRYFRNTKPETATNLRAASSPWARSTLGVASNLAVSVLEKTSNSLEKGELIEKLFLRLYSLTFTYVTFETQSRERRRT